jgi:hypothetical protein
MDPDPSGMGPESIPDGIVLPPPREQLPSAMIENPMAMGLQVQRVDIGIPSPLHCVPTTSGSSINRVGVECRPPLHSIPMTMDPESHGVCIPGPSPDPGMQTRCDSRITPLVLKDHSLGIRDHRVHDPLSATSGFRLRPRCSADSRRSVFRRMRVRMRFEASRRRSACLYP